MGALADDPREAVRLWLRMLAATSLVERAVRQRLRAEFGTTLPRFDVMAALERAPDGLAMGELSRRLMVSNGNATVIVDALEREGLAARAVSETDRRSFRVALTPAGRRQFTAMAEAHAGWIAELLGDLDADEAGELAGLLGAARRSVEAAEARRAPEEVA